MLISVHIPKTAGMSFGSSLRDVYGDRLFWAYETQPRLYSNLSIQLSWLKCKVSHMVRTRRIIRKYDAIHGHFFADAFEHLPVPKQYCVFMRDPVERVISHYLFWKERYEKFRREGRKPPRLSLWTQMIENEMSLTEFAASPGMVKFYPVFLGRMPMDRFDFVGLMEEYSTSLQLFEKVFGIKLQEIKTNVTSRAPYSEMLSSVDLENVRLAQKQNRMIYDQARRRFDSLCSQYL